MPRSVVYLYKVSLVRVIDSVGERETRDVWVVCSGLEVVNKILAEAYPMWTPYAYDRMMEDVVVQGGISTGL